MPLRLDCVEPERVSRGPDLPESARDSVVPPTGTVFKTDRDSFATRADESEGAFYLRFRVSLLRIDSLGFSANCGPNEAPLRASTHGTTHRMAFPGGPQLSRS